MQPTAPATASSPAPIETDALVIGAGPVGLFQVFELGLLEMRAHIVDTLEAPGGQCVELYGDKPIYDIPALPRATGRELVQRLMEQLRPFAPGMHLGQEVTQLEAQPDGRFAVETSAGTRFLARVVVIAGGVGSFQPRSLPLTGLDAHRGGPLWHRPIDIAMTCGQDVIVAGDGDAALDWAVTLARAGAQRPRSVTLMHRRDVFQAAPESVERMRQACTDGVLRLLIGQPEAIEEQAGRLSGLQVLDAEGVTHRLPLDTLFVLLGLSPKLGPIARWGLEMERKQLRVDTARFETSVPGIFAVGDINTYPGKRKLIVCGFHEATLAAFAAAERVFPQHPVQLQYTTTSPRLHQLLGALPLP